MALRLLQAHLHAGPAALRNKTYPLPMILGALTDYAIGYTLEETAARLSGADLTFATHPTASS
jgi:hypothetical protein